MKKFKDLSTGVIFEVNNENHISIYERYGYEEVKEAPKATPKKTTKK